MALTYDSQVFHLVLETPEPNLVSGMRILRGPFAHVWNSARMRRGHVFQGRYKSVPVKAKDLYYFRIVADYIHPNPARAIISRSLGDDILLDESQVFRVERARSLRACQRETKAARLDTLRYERRYDLPKTTEISTVGFVIYGPLTFSRMKPITPVAVGVG